jgi:hypothetical protein
MDMEQNEGAVAAEGEAISDQSRQEELLAHQKAMQEYQERQSKYQKALYKRHKIIYDDGMQKWQSYHDTSAKMDDRFDSRLFAVAAGSFGLSFAFVGNVIDLASAERMWALFAAWICFAGCLVIMTIGHLLSAETYRKHRDNVAENISLAYEDKPPKDIKTIDTVSPCNYGSLGLYIGGVACLLFFVISNL